MLFLVVLVVIIAHLVGCPLLGWFIGAILCLMALCMGYENSNPNKRR